MFCPPLVEYLAGFNDRGFTHGEVYLAMLPDGSLDYTSAMHFLWKGDNPQQGEN